MINHRKIGVLLATAPTVLMALTFVLPATTAANPYCAPGAAGTWHCFSGYEGGSDTFAIRFGCEALGGCLTMSDENVDVGAVFYDGCLSSDHANNGGSPNRDWPHCATGTAVDPDPVHWDLETVQYVDDIYGSDVGGFYCTDNNDDFFCGDPSQGELAVIFCGGLDVGLTHATNTDAFTLGYFVVGPQFQPIDCPGTANPVGGTTGTVAIWIQKAPFGWAPECSDGFDNGDFDGSGDWPADPGCDSVGDRDETSRCENGIDDDSDGAPDFADVGCSSPADNDEANPGVPPECSDGADNDFDGTTDGADAGCTSPGDNNESTPQCSDGIDNDFDGQSDAGDPGCVNPDDDDEVNPGETGGCATFQTSEVGGERLAFGTADPCAPQCSDGVDNDGDGAIDETDNGCTGPADDDETGGGHANYGNWGGGGAG